MLIGVKSADARTVNYSCSGTSYPANIIANLVVFVSPSSELRQEDCNQQVTFADGTTSTKRM